MALARARAELSVQSFFIGDVDGGESVCEERMWTEDWLQAAKLHSDGPEGSVGRSPRRGRPATQRTRKRAPAVQMEAGKLKGVCIHIQKKGAVLAKDCRNVGDPVARADTEYHVQSSSPEVRLRNTGVG